MSTTLLLIDPQNDFCDPQGSLFVPGADADCKRLAAVIAKNAADIDSIHITLDSHDYWNIAHPVFWKDAYGNELKPFTLVSGADFKAKKYMPRDSALAEYAEWYIGELEKKHRYQLMLWPPHCLIGSWGYCVQANVLAAVRGWQKTKLKPVDFVLKGRNPLTEHYSAIEAEVPIKNDAATLTNYSLLEELKAADTVLAAGEALSHCVAFTLRDAAAHIGAEKITLLADCSSSVAGFEAAGKAFVDEMLAKGMRVKQL